MAHLKSCLFHPNLARSFQGVQESSKAQEVGNWGWFLKSTCCWINSFLYKDKTEQNINTVSGFSGSRWVFFRKSKALWGDFWLNSASTSKDHSQKLRLCFFKFSMVPLQKNQLLSTDGYFLKITFLSINLNFQKVLLPRRRCRAKIMLFCSSGRNFKEGRSENQEGQEE